MICEKILGNIHETDTEEKTIDRVRIDWFEHNKHLLKKTSEGGCEIGIRVSEPLKDGDILCIEGETIFAVELEPCDLIEISVRDTVEMGRLCFEIGNRHISPAISADRVRIPYDEPTLLHLLKHGFKASRVFDKFTGYIECRGHTHSN